ncbi:MAG TPA: hypothetical protein VKP65_10915 [Rhodothermales bacterium]|nr:hypothetical protein [Rhodothermales bacterium]
MSPKGQSIFIGGIVVALLSTSYLGLINLFCCAGVIIGSMAAVWHYTSENELTVPAGEGAVMGLSAAALGVVIATIINFILIKMGIRHDLAMSGFIMEQFGGSMPPEQVEAMEEQMNQPVTVGAYLVNGLVGIVVSVIFGAIGGAIGAAIFKKGPDSADAETGVV